MPSRRKSIQLSTQELIDVYQWVKQFNLSKDIKNINRDLTDGGIGVVLLGLFGDFTLISHCLCSPGSGNPEASLPEAGRSAQLYEMLRHPQQARQLADA